MNTDYTQIISLADQLTDREKARIAIQNQMRSLGGTDFARLPSYAGAVSGVKFFEAAEKSVTKQLESVVKAHPIWPFFADARGCGPKSAGRLLGLLGNPLCYIDQEGELIERTVGSLWHYCGYAPGHDKRTKGEQMTYNPTARKQLFVITGCFIKSGGHYKDVYDARKLETVGRPHAAVCKNSVRPVAGKPAGSNGCGTQEHPEWGAIGAPWRPNHCHYDAIRITAKEFLKDLWVAAGEQEAGALLAA
jgi:hypothetical protein